MGTTGVQRVALETSIPQIHLSHSWSRTIEYYIITDRLRAIARRHIRRDNLIRKKRWEKFLAGVDRITVPYCMSLSLFRPSQSPVGDWRDWRSGGHRVRRPPSHPRNCTRTILRHGWERVSDRTATSIASMMSCGGVYDAPVSSVTMGAYGCVLLYSRQKGAPHCWAPHALHTPHPHVRFQQMPFNKKANHEHGHTGV